MKPSPILVPNSSSENRVMGGGLMKVVALLLALSLVLLFADSIHSQDPYWTMHPINERPLSGATGVGVGDLDGSGYADVIVAAKDIGDRVVWYENPYPPPVPIYWAEHNVDSSADGAREIAIADMDRDHDLDIVAAIRDEDRIVWYDNSFVSPDENWPMYEIGTLERPRGVCTAYINGDNLLDVVASGMQESTVVWYEAPIDPTADAWLEHTVDDSLRGVKGVFALDMDGDTDIDIVAAGRDCNDVVWYEQISSEPVAWEKHFIDRDLLGAVSVWCGDLVGDEKPEVAVTAKTGAQVVIYEQPEDVGDPWRPTVIDSMLLEACPISGADFDGDGHTDIAAAGRSAHTLAWYKSPHGISRTWVKTIIDTSIGSCMGLTTGDLDNDGDIDIVLTSTEGYIAWYENDILAGVTDAATARPDRMCYAWPNPWRKTVTLYLSDSRHGTSVRFRIFDAAGRLVWTSGALGSQNETLTARWDGRTTNGQSVPSGVYFWHMRLPHATYCGKVVKLQ
jgi:hypothetical protein